MLPRAGNQWSDLVHPKYVPFIRILPNMYRTKAPLSYFLWSSKTCLTISEHKVSERLKKTNSWSAENMLRWVKYVYAKSHSLNWNTQHVCNSILYVCSRVRSSITNMYNKISMTCMRIRSLTDTWICCMSETYYRVSKYMFSCSKHYQGTTLPN